MDRSRPTLLFEYGSGRSTAWWAERCDRVVSVEHAIHWFRDVRAMVPANVDLLFENLGEGYWNKVLDYEPDFVVIDGRHRKACALAVSQLHRPPAAVLFDDAERPWYQAGLDLFSDYRALTFNCEENPVRRTRLFIHPYGKFKDWLT